MKQNDLHRLMDLIDDIKKIDSMVLLHQELDSSDFMTSQYQSKKTMLVSKFIDELVSPSLQSTESFYIIQAILSKFYPLAQNKELYQAKELNQLLAAI